MDDLAGSAAPQYPSSQYHGQDQPEEIPEKYFVTVSGFEDLPGTPNIGVEAGQQGDYTEYSPDFRQL